MYAIVDIAGQQFRVEKGQEIYVHRLKGKEGSKVDFDRVLFINNQGKTVFGTPVVEGAGITCMILEHTKADKVLVFKKKNRKGYQKLNGHRQYMSLIRVEEIIETGMKPVKKEEAKPKAKAPKAEKEPAPAKAKQTKAAAKKEVKEEKPVVKKAATAKAPAKVKKETKAEKPAQEKETKKAAPKKAATPKAKKETGKSDTAAKKSEKKSDKESGNKE